MSRLLKIHDGEKTVLPLRITRRKKRGSKGARILIRCGCCEQRVEIYPDGDPLPTCANIHTSLIEINGVCATVDQWRQVFRPLLGL